jgi:hypothetical protein
LLDPDELAKAFTAFMTALRGALARRIPFFSSPGAPARRVARSGAWPLEDHDGAFMIAVRGTVWQAVLLGLSAAVSHTIIVWVLALAALRHGSDLAGERNAPPGRLVGGQRHPGTGGARRCCGAASLEASRSTRRTW